MHIGRSVDNGKESNAAYFWFRTMSSRAILRVVVAYF